MVILGIETSCDETAAAVVKDGRKILSNVIASSAEIHAKTGGIVPEQAARQQVVSIIPVIQTALVKAFNKGKPTTNSQLLTTKLDAIAVTVGPGLIGSLLVGVETAKTLSFFWKKPIIPINHLTAHIYANWLETKSQNRQQKTDNKVPEFPVLALVVSGGHTDLVLMKSHSNIKWIGGTRDDAAGEAFDKTARLLELGYPGGPAISVEAEKFSNSQPTTNNSQLNMFPRPMINSKDFDWSFSGLKTSVLRTVQTTNNIKHWVPEISANIQEAIVDVLVVKTLKAVRKYKPKSLLLAGGVAANKRLREKFKMEIGKWKLETRFFVPPPELCTDNAAYIAACAFFNNNKTRWKNIKANPELTVISKT